VTPGAARWVALAFARNALLDRMLLLPGILRKVALLGSLDDAAIASFVP
jgi:hypothetical protein